jgi:hypothetical protein
VGTQGAVIHCTRPSLSPLVDAAPLLLLPLALYLPDSLPLAIRAWFGAQLLRYGTPSRHDLSDRLRGGPHISLVRKKLQKSDEKFVKVNFIRYIKRPPQELVRRSSDLRSSRIQLQ